MRRVGETASDRPDKGQVGNGLNHIEGKALV